MGRGIIQRRAARRPTPTVCTVGVLVLCLALSGPALGLTIPKEQFDPQKIFSGNPKEFAKPAEVDIDKVVKSTPEYLTIKKQKIKRGTGKFWILMSQASARSMRAIAEVAKGLKYDLVTKKGYLGKLKPPIPADDITDKVVAKITGKDKKGGKKKEKEKSGSEKDSG